MRTAAQIWSLSRAALGLWWRFAPQLVIWFCVGFLLREAGLFASTWLSGRRFELGIVDGSAQFWVYRGAETLVFIAGVVGWVVCLVLMIASTRPGLPAVAQGRLPDAVAGGVLPPDRRRELIFDAVPAFLAVFAVGGFAEDQADALFQANLATWGTRFENFSVSLADWRFYGVLMLLAAGLAVLTRLLIRGRRLGRALLNLAAKSITLLAGFLALTGLLRDGGGWLMSRRVWQWGRRGWQSFLDSLPDWTLWQGLTLPEVVREGGQLFWGTVVPGLIDSVAVPLLWLALTATVFGWYDFHHGVAASRREQKLLDASRRLTADQGGVGPGQVLRRWLVQQAEDYLPTLQAIRLVLRSGLRFAIAFVIVMALLSFADAWLNHAADLVVGPLTERELAFGIGFFALLELPARTLWVAVLAVSFDRALQLLTAHAASEAPVASEASTAS